MAEMFENNRPVRRKRKKIPKWQRILRRWWPLIRLALIGLAAILVIWMLWGFISGIVNPEDPGNTDPSPSETDPEFTDPDSTDPEPTDPEPTDPEPTDPEPTEPEPTDPEILPPELGNPDADFSQGAVGEEWFENTLFIGNFGTVNLRNLARIDGADYFCTAGMTVFSCLDHTISDIGFEEQTLESLLSSKTYDKIVLNLGINECGYSTSYFISTYSRLLDTIRESQPDAVIILQAVIMVTEDYAGEREYFTPQHLQSMNDRIEGLADNETVFFVDVNPYFTDSNGWLNSGITSDGCQLTAHYYRVWASWLNYAVAQLGIE